MDFEYSETCQQLMTQLQRFMDEHVYPNESLYAEQVEESGDPHFEPPEE